MGPSTMKICIKWVIWILLISLSFADKDLEGELESQSQSISDNDLENQSPSIQEDELESQNISIPELEQQMLKIISTDLESRSLAMIEDLKSPSNISKASLGATCNSELFEKYAAVHITQASTSHEYNETFQRMKVDIKNSKYNATDVCFHNKYFMECSIVTHQCQCARTGIWKNYNFMPVGNHCYVGTNGRCHPNKTRHLICVNGTKCKKTDEKYDKHKPQYKCSGSESFYQIQQVTLWAIFVGVALLWRE